MKRHYPFPRIAGSRSTRSPFAFRLSPFLVFLALAPAAFAQPDTSRPPGLPDIAPREVEIRGQLEIQFPSLQRQPLTGFNPPPRVVPLPPDRRPWVGAYKQEKADLPPSPLQAPEPPEVSAFVLRPPRSGEAEGSFGSYFSRLARARLEAPVAPGAALYARLDYRGTTGHDPDHLGVEDVDASFDALSARAGLQAGDDGVAFGGEVDAMFDDLSLYATEVAAAASGEAPQRTGQGLGGAVWLRTQGSTDLDGRLRLHFGRTSYETGGGGLDSPVERREGRFTAEGALAIPFRSFAEARLDLAVSTATLRGDDELDEALDDATARHFSGMAGLRYRHLQAFDLAAGLRLLTFAAAEREGTYVAPDFRLSLHPGRQATFYVQNRPGVDANALGELFRTNPYLVAAPEVAPTVRTLDAEAGATFLLGPVELEGRAGYVRSPGYRYFERATSGEAQPFGSGLSSVRYDRAAITHVGGDVSVVLPAGFNASAGLTFRRGRLLEDDTIIPNFGPIVGRAALSYAFLEDRGLIQLTGTYESARHRDRAESRKLGDFADLDLAVSYDISPAVGLVFRAENLSGRYNERWDLYEQPPFVVMGGFRVLW